jgi:hypothetical protein
VKDLGRPDLPLGGEVTALGDALAVERHECGLEAGRLFRLSGLEGGGQVPVARRDERDALALTLDHQAGGDALHAARRELRHDLLPQHRADLIAVQPVEDAAGLLRVDELDVQLARAARGGADGVRGDLVEHHAVYRDLGLQDLLKVPGDRLALAVLICREEELVGVLQELLELGDLLLLVGVDDIERLEAMINIDSESGPRLALEFRRDIGRSLGKIADVADAGLHDVPVAEITRDGLGLRG